MMVTVVAIRKERKENRRLFMKNKLISFLAAITVAAASFTPVMAEWHPSQAQTGVTVPEGSETITVGDKQISVTTDAAKYNTTDPVILVSPVSAPHDALTTTVYNDALKAGSQSIDAFLTKYGVQAAVNAKLKEIAGETAKSEDLVMVGMADVTANDAAKAIINETNPANITLAMSGIKASGKYIAVHFTSETSAEVLPASWADGSITVTMSSFSPVMILSYNEGSSAADAAKKNTGKTANTSDNSNVLLYGGIMAVAVVAAGIVFFSTRKKSGQD